MAGQKVSEDHRRGDILRAAYEVAARRGVEALTVRDVAVRAAVSHGTVLFHFKRRNELVASLLERVLDATVVLRVPPAVARLTTATARMEALLRAEMERLSGDPRRFRLFLEYWALGVRYAPIRRKVSAALDRYRGAFRALADQLLQEERELDGRQVATGVPEASATPDELAAVAVSLVHGCALQAVIDPGGSGIQQHFDAAARLLGQLASSPVTSI